ncbi:MAG: hypothetical protein ACTSP1_17325 [Candidatus Freyarchaeota archaeon]
MEREEKETSEMCNDKGLAPGSNLIQKPESAPVVSSSSPGYSTNIRGEGDHGFYELNRVLLYLENGDSKSLISLIDGERDIGVIGFVLDTILWRNRRMAEEVAKGINLEGLMEKVLLEKNLDRISFLISRFSWLSRKINRKLVEKVDLVSLAKKIDDEHDLETISQILFDLYSCCEETAKRLLNEINFERLLEKIIREEDFEKIAMLIYYLYLIHGGFSEKLTKIVRTKVKSESDLKSIIEFFFKLRLVKGRFEGKLYLLDLKRREQGSSHEKETKKAEKSPRIDTDILRQIVERIDLENLANKINTERRFERIFEFFTELAKLNREIIIELLSRVNIEHLVLKYELDRQETFTPL